MPSQFCTDGLHGLVLTSNFEADEFASYHHIRSNLDHHIRLVPKTLPRSSPCCLGLSPLRGLLCVNHAIFCGTVTLASEIHRESTLALGHFHKTHDNTIGIVICFCYFAHCNFFVVLHKPTQHTFKVKSFYWVVHASAGQWKGSASFSGLLHSFTRNDFSHSVSYIYLKGEWSCPDLFQ